MSSSTALATHLPGLLGPSRRAAWRRTVLRRVLAVALVLLALHLATAAVRQPTSGIPVVVAAADVPAGATIGREDVTLQETVGPPPSSAATSADDLVGRRAGIAIARGEVLTPARAIGAGSLADLPADHRAVALPLVAPPPEVRSGDRVDVLEGGRSDPVVRDALVLSVDVPDDSAVAPAAGDARVVVAVTEESAGRLVSALDPDRGGGFVLALRP